MIDLQRNLVDLRREKNLTQKEVAEKIGVSAAAIGFWETGINEPKATYLIKLANFFGVTIEELVGSDIPTPEERAAGASATRRVIITPAEDELLHVFRKLGKQRGAEAQQAIITMIEKMCN